MSMVKLNEKKSNLQFIALERNNDCNMLSYNILQAFDFDNGKLIVNKMQIVLIFLIVE
jgi:hypothetical protein